MSLRASTFRILTAIALCASVSMARGASLPEATDQQLASWGVTKLETFFPRDTGIRDEVRSIATLPNGELAVLSYTGIHIFDGTHWNSVGGDTIDARNATRLPDGGVAIATGLGLVELLTDPTGGYFYSVFSTPEEVAGGAHSLETITTARGHIFGLQGTNLIEVDSSETVHAHKLPAWASTVFAIDDEVYITGGGTSLLNRWDWQTRQFVDHSHVFQTSVYEWVVEVQPRAEGGVWMLTEMNNIIGFDGKRTWLWEGSSVLAERDALAKSFVETKPNHLAVGTSAQGVLFFDENGALARQLSKPHGLDDVSVVRLGTDNQDGLWIATKRSISRIPLESPTRVFDERHGLTEQVNAIAFFRDRIYLATDAGVFASNPTAQSMENAFELVDANRNASDLYVHGDHLFIAAGKIMVMDQQGEMYEISGDGGTNFLQPSRFPNLMLAGNYKGVQVFEKEGAKWSTGRLLPGSGPDVFSMAEHADGSLWGSLGSDKIARILLAEDGQRRVEYLQIPAHVENPWSMVVEVEGEIYLNTKPTLRWDPEQQTWVDDPSMVYYVGAAPFGFEQVFGWSRDNAYVCTNGRRGETLRRPNDRIIGEISSLSNSVDTRGTCLVYDDRGIAWIGGPFGLVRAIDPLAPVDPLADAPRLHRIHSTKDGIDLPLPEFSEGPFVLDPHQNLLRFEVEYRNFQSSLHNQYQIYVEGLDSEWPDFSSVPFREITNLEPGNYILRVQARTAAGLQTPAYELRFTLLAYWYQRPWAYALYVTTALLAVLATIRFITLRHVRRSKQLQLLVEERTQEVQAKNLELERQAETLEIQNSELAEKTDELEATTASLTETLHQLQDAQDQLVSTARTAGKAEIATNVLHNVGNVLNSINTSLSTLSKKVANSHVSKLSRLAKLVEERKHDIDRFLTSDQRGKHVPEYLINVAIALQEETSSIAQELASMESEVDHIKRIISAQQTHAKTYSVCEEVRLTELCQTAFTILGGEPTASPLDIAQDVSESIILQSDKHRLLEIILNLISNAKEAIEEQRANPGTIAVSAKFTDDRENVILTIADNGVGIDPDHQLLLFNHGFTTKSHGHGFGLHSAAIAAKTLGGELSLSSPGKGKGATATLTLPVKFEVKNQAASRTAPAQSSLVR